MRVATQINLDDEERARLTRWFRGRSIRARLVLRAQITLLAAEGKQSKDIAADLGTSRQTVGLWRRRFVTRRVAGIEKDAPRGGREPLARLKVERRIIEKTTRERPREATHWTTRTLAKELGVSHSMVHRVWKAWGLRPHIVRTFKLSNDPHFIENYDAPVHP